MSQEIRPEFNMATEYFKTMAELILLQNKYAIESRITLNFSSLRYYYSITKQLWIRIRPFAFENDIKEIDNDIKEIEDTFISLIKNNGKRDRMTVFKLLISLLKKIDDLAIRVHHIGSMAGQFQPYSIKEGKKERISKAISGEYG